MKAQVPGDIAVERLGGGVFHALSLGEPDHLDLLGDHIHDDIGGKAVGAVGKPLDKVGVLQGGHPDGAAQVVDLGVVVRDLKLAYHIRQGAHLSGAKPFGRVLVQQRDLIKGDFGDVGGKIPGLHVEQFPVGPGPEDRGREDGAHNADDNDGCKDDAYGEALLLDKREILSGAAVLHMEAGGDKGADKIDHAQQADEHIEVAGLEVEGRQRDVEINGAEDGGDHKIQQDFARLAPGNPGPPGRFILTQCKNLLCIKVISGIVSHWQYTQQEAVFTALLTDFKKTGALREAEGLTSGHSGDAETRPSISEMVRKCNRAEENGD